MPMTLLPIPETTESITRPVMLEVVRQLMQLTGISPKTNLVYFGDMEKQKQLQSAIAEHGDDLNMFVHNDKIELEVSEIYAPDRVPNEPMFDPENLLIFYDPALDIIMKPAYATMDSTITVKYRASNKNQAIQWRAAMKAKISQHRDLNLHDITYSFGVPEEYLYILKYLHGLRENVAGYGDTFDEYFDANRLPKMRKLTNMSGSASLWVVPETQVRVQGWFDFDLPEEAARGGDGEAVITSFSYKFGYQRPETVVMVYPLMVHNQLIDLKYRQPPLRDHTDTVKSYAYHSRVLAPFEGAQISDKQRFDFGYAIPTFDEFVPASIPIKSRRVVTVLFDIDQANTRQVLSLQDLGQKKFTPEIIEYMKSEQSYLLRPCLSALHVALYKNTSQIEPDPPSIAIDADLNITLLTEPDLRHQHHIRVGLLTDLQLLRGNALARLQEHGQAAIQILMAIDPTLLPRGLIPPLIGDNFISKVALVTAIQNVRPNNNPMSALNHFNTVQIFFVETNHDHSV